MPMVELICLKVAAIVAGQLSQMVMTFQNLLGYALFLLAY